MQARIVDVLSLRTASESDSSCNNNINNNNNNKQHGNACMCLDDQDDLQGSSREDDSNRDVFASKRKESGLMKRDILLEKGHSVLRKSNSLSQIVTKKDSALLGEGKKGAITPCSSLRKSKKGKKNEEDDRRIETSRELESMQKEEDEEVHLQQCMSDLMRGKDGRETVTWADDGSSVLNSMNELISGLEDWQAERKHAMEALEHRQKLEMDRLNEKILLQQQQQSDFEGLPWMKEDQNRQYNSYKNWDELLKSEALKFSRNEHDEEISRKALSCCKNEDDYDIEGELALLKLDLAVKDMLANNGTEPVETTEDYMKELDDVVTLEEELTTYNDHLETLLNKLT